MSILDVTKLPKLHVGQTIYYRKIDDRQGADLSLREATVTKIGKIYFYVDPEWLGKFEILTLRQGSSFSGYQAYLSREDYEQEQLHKALQSKLMRYFQNGNFKLTIAQMQAIVKIIEPQP
jgi:hypothetical protein